jgi:hypothetical protein
MHPLGEHWHDTAPDGFRPRGGFVFRQPLSAAALPPAPARCATASSEKSRLFSFPSLKSLEGCVDIPYIERTTRRKTRQKESMDMPDIETAEYNDRMQRAYRRALARLRASRNRNVRRHAVRIVEVEDSLEHFRWCISARMSEIASWTATVLGDLDESARIAGGAA